MRLEKASYKAIKYACLKFHYAERVPAQPMVAYSVFNEKNEWCGVVIFNNGIGAIAKPFKMKNGEVYELVRVALNGKHNKTSQVVSRAVKLFKKDQPLVKILVSYADTDLGHEGIIYKAMNWVYILTNKTGNKYIDPKTGKDIHSRSHSKTGYNIQFGTRKKVKKTNELIKIEKGVKHKFVYPLYKEYKVVCENMRE